MTIWLSVPKRAGRKTVWVKASLSHYWTATCEDPAIAAKLEALKPEWPLGYLPPPLHEWVRISERVLSARVESIEETPSSGPIPGVCMSAGPENQTHRVTTNDGAAEIADNSAAPGTCADLLKRGNAARVTRRPGRLARKRASK